MHVSVCLHEKALMCVTGANSYVRGEVTPSLLSLGVCRGLYQLSNWVKTFYPSTHTCINRRTHTQPPRYH